MTIHILDPSAAIETVLNRPKLSFYSEILMKSDLVIAPDLFICEISNVFWKYHQFDLLPMNICERTLALSLELVDNFIDALTLYKEAFSLACSTQHPVYDMMYLVLARKNNGILLIIDRKLKNIAGNYSIPVNKLS